VAVNWAVWPTVKACVDGATMIESTRLLVQPARARPNPTWLPLPKTQAGLCPPSGGKSRSFTSTIDYRLSLAGTDVPQKRHYAFRIKTVNKPISGSTKAALGVDKRGVWSVQNMRG
jgi:hypothetical protein